jgi:integrase
MKITLKSIQNLTLRQDQREKTFFDDDLPGFGVRVRAGGSKMYVVQYKIGPKHRRLTLGKVGGLDLNKARTAAKDALAAARLGHDPAGEKIEARQLAAETFGALLPRYLTRQRAKLKPRSYQETERHLLAHAKAFHELPVKKIDRRTIATRLAEIEEHSGPAASNRVRASLSAYLSWLAREGYIEANPASFTNRAVENGARHHVPSDADLRAIWLALEGDDYGAIVKLLLLTGARRDEIGGLRWSEVDLDDASITLPPPRVKNKREHLIPLSEPALAILKAQPRRSAPDGTPRDHIFGRGTARGYQGWSKSKADLDARIAEANHGREIEPWRLHDFRRSLSTSLHGKRFGVPPHVVEVMLGHVGGHKGGVAGVYNKEIYRDERKSALERWGVHTMELVTGKWPKAKVVGLRGGRS